MIDNNYAEINRLPITKIELSNYLGIINGNEYCHLIAKARTKLNQVYN